MTVPTSEVVERIEQLVSLFNRGSLDLPDGLVDRNAQFRLNGGTYEDTLGRSPDDPLVRLIARGPGAYRFLAKGLRYAVPDARVALGALTRQSTAGGFTLDGSATLTGLLRGSADAIEAVCRIALVFDTAAQLIGVGVDAAPDVLSRLQSARNHA